MSGRSSLRVLTAGVLTLVLALGGPAATSFAEETEPTTAPTPTEVVEPPTQTEPAPTRPAPSEPEPGEPALVEPAPIEPAPSTPAQPEEPRPGSDEPAGEFKPTPSDPAPAQPDAQALPDLRMTASFDKKVYLHGEKVRIAVTVTNAGSVAAENIVGYENGYGDDYAKQHPVLESPGWGDLTMPGRGVRLEPGASLTINLAGHVADPTSTRVAFMASVQTFDGDANWNDNRVDLKADIVEGFGDIRGTIYADRNSNGTVDQGEGLPGVRITGVRNETFVGYFDLKTDADGRYSVPGTPSGNYRLSYTSPEGWYVVLSPPGYEERVVLSPGGELNLVRKAVRPLSESLQASMLFQERTYRVGDQARLSVTLTNTGPTAATGITAKCYGVDSDAPGWGSLRHSGSGITVPAGATTVVDVTEPVGDDDLNVGHIRAGCQFDNFEEGTGTGPYASDVVDVPGATGTAEGRLVYDRNNDYKYDDDGIANTKVVLVDPRTDSAVARTVTDATGNLEFLNVPTGSYRLFVVGPWKALYQEALDVEVIRDETWPRIFMVVPGTDQGDLYPEPAPPAQPAPVDPPPAAAGGGGAAVAVSTAAALASTGASVTGLFILGIGVLLAGAGALLATRRRSTAAVRVRSFIQ